MTETAVGTAKLLLTADTSQWEVAVQRAQQQQLGLGAVVQKEAEKMTRAQRQVVASLDAQATKIGLTREQWLQYKVITQTTGETQTALLAKIKANTVEIERQGNAAQKTGIQFNQYDRSQKQVAAAMRQVPAQLTDIFVSLQGGQNPLTVLLQQGGQLKDVFGGVAPAARALGGALVKLINPFTGLAVAIGAVGFAYLQGEQRSNAFNRAIVLTGQQGVLTAAQLNDIAQSLDQVSGVTSRQAAAALTQVVASGRIAADQYQLVTQAAVMMADATGKAVQETIAEYADLARDPVSAVLRLNETERFLTQSVYERIRAMQDAGDIEGAAALATEARAAAQIQRAQEVVDSLGLVAGGWHSVKEGAAEAWDAAVDYFSEIINGAEDSTASLAQLKNEWVQLRAENADPLFAGFNDDRSGRISEIQAELRRRAEQAKKKEDDKKTLVDSVAQKQLDALMKGNETREQRQSLEEKQIRNLYAQAGATKQLMTLEQALAASRARYKESLPKGRSGAGEVRSLANAGAQAALQEIKNQETVARNEIQNTGKVLEAEYAARLMTTSAYHAKQRDLATRDLATQEASLVKQVAYLRSRDVAGKDSINVTRQISEIEAQLAKIRADGATQHAISGIQDVAIDEKRKRAADEHRQALEAFNIASRDQTDASLARIILGEREAEQQEKLAAIRADAAEKEREYAREFADTKDDKAYQENLDRLREFTEARVRTVEEGYSRMLAAEGDWLNGMKGGFASWMEGANNVAAQTKAITTNALDGTVDMLTNFAMTGKLVWKDLLRDIGEQIVKFMIKQAVLKFLQYFLGGSGGGAWSENTSTTGFGGGVQYAAKGGAFSGAAGLSKHSGTVVSQPTPFYFAKGAGVMGEAGMEGIFPLQRGSDGKLGVKATGGGSAAPVYITTNVTINGDGSSSSSTQTAGEQAAMLRQLAGDMSNVAQHEIMRATMPGGTIWKMRGG